MTPLKKNISFNIHDVNTWKEKNLSKKKEKLKKKWSCAAYGCTNKWKADYEIRFYKIPKDNDLRQKWLNNIRREGKLPKDENFYICSIHFEESCFQWDLKVC